MGRGFFLLRQALLVGLARAQVPVQAVVAQAPVQAVAQGPVQAVAQAPVQAVAQAPVQTAAQAPVQAVAQAPAATVAPAPVQAVAQVPGQVVARAPGFVVAQERALQFLPDQALAVVSTEEEVPIGCFNYGYKFTPALQNITGQPFRLTSVLDCQKKCRGTLGCFHFAFWKKTGECWLGDLQSKLVKAPTKGAVCGPAYCPQDPPACTGIPNPDFPASTDAATRAAWPGGEQPTNLQCWPRLSNGFPDRCHTRMATVLEDTEAGWPGMCDNLRRITDLAAGETCQLRCFNSALCGVWSVENVSNAGVPTCWHGMFAYNCESGGGGIRPMRAQRIMHGTFRVLMNTMGMQIMNLSKAFSATDVGTVREGAKRCRKTCLSYLFCQHWQYSPEWGCWVEDPRTHTIAYPLINNGVDMVTQVASANTVKAGEYIQHFCANEPTVPLPTDSPISGAVAKPQSAHVALAGVQNQHVTLGHGVVPAGAEAGSSARGVDNMDLPEGMPAWASVLIGFAVALCLAVVCVIIYLAVMEKDKQGTRGVHHLGGHHMYAPHGPHGASFDSHVSSASESAPFLQGNGHFGMHLPQFHPGSVYQDAHMAVAAASGHAIPGYGHVGVPPHGQHPGMWQGMM